MKHILEEITLEKLFHLKFIQHDNNLINVHRGSDSASKLAIFWEVPPILAKGGSEVEEKRKQLYAFMQLPPIPLKLGP